MTTVHLRLSASRINATRPGERDKGLSDDDGVRGTGRLYLRIMPGGTQRFYYRYPRLKGVQVPPPKPIGPYSRVSRPGYSTIQQARAAAARIAAEWRLAQQSPRATEAGHAAVARDRAAAAGTALAVTPPDLAVAAARGDFRDGLTVAEMCRSYITTLKNDGKPSAGEAERGFRRFIYDRPGVAQSPAGEVDAAAWTQVLHDVVRASTKLTTNRLRTYLHAAYEQSMNAKHDPLAPEPGLDPQIESNPIAKIRPIRGAKRARKRVLTRTEQRETWGRLSSASDNDLSLAMRAVRLDIRLGGQRCKQLLRAQISDVDLDEGVLHLSDTKGRREEPRDHTIPLTTTAKAEVRWLVQRSQDMGSRWLFASGRGKCLNNATVSKVVTQISRDLLGQKSSMSRFQYADLRRTVETELANLDVPPHVRAHLQSHELSGVQLKHYDMHDYQRQVRRALELWERHLDELLAEWYRAHAGAVAPARLSEPILRGASGRGHAEGKTAAPAQQHAALHQQIGVSPGRPTTSQSETPKVSRGVMAAAHRPPGAAGSRPGGVRGA